MSSYYKTGRSRTIRIVNTVTITACWVGGFLTGYGQGFGLTGATVGGYRGFTIYGAISGTGHFPVVAANNTGVQSITATITMTRTVQLEERFLHENNGARGDFYGGTGTCTETWTDGTTTYTTKNASLVYIPGHEAGAFEVFGLGTHAVNPFAGAVGAFSRNGHYSSLSPPYNIGYTTGDMSISWTWGYVDAGGDAIFPDPAVPSESSTAGSSRWGSVIALGASAPPSGLIDNTLYRQRSVGATIAHFPQYGLDVQMAPLSLPGASPVVQHHRLQIDYASLLGGSTPSTGTDYISGGENVMVLCGGTKWETTHSALKYNGVSWVPEDSSGWGRHTFNGMLPLVSQMRVTHWDSNQHYFCQVRAPFDAMGLTQASSVAVPGAASLSCPVGNTTLTVALDIGYRYLRVVAKTPVGTGTLTIKSYLNGDATNHTASQVLTTTTANTNETIEIDLLEVAGCTTDPDLTLDSIKFTATSNTFTVVSAELFRKHESIVQCLSSRRALQPLQMSFVSPWIECYTDGVRSKLQNISGNFITGAITLSSFTVRQLVQEMNATTRHNYGAWNVVFPHQPAILGSAVTSISSLLGWTATEATAPRGAKGYTSSEVYEPEDWEDSDVYLPALHGDGIIGSGLYLTGTGTLQAQRFSASIVPGYLPGKCGYDGAAGEEFGTGAGDLITPVRFVGLFRGLAQGMEIGTLKALPIAETDETNSGVSAPITPEVPVGLFQPRASGFSLSSQGLQGTRSNKGDGKNIGRSFEIRENTIYNDGGTATTGTLYPYHRDRPYLRFWLDDEPGDVIGMANSATGRVVRGVRTTANVLLLEFWYRGFTAPQDWQAVTTSLTLTGGGALSYDRKGAEQRLWLDYEDSGAIKSRYTDDEGGTFSVATTIASAGTYPAITHSPTSVAHHYWVDGSAIKTKALDSQGNELVASSTVVASGVAASPIAAVHDGETILLTYKNGSGAVITVISTDGGVTFS